MLIDLNAVSGIMWHVTLSRSFYPRSFYSNLIVNISYPNFKNAALHPRSFIMLINVKLMKVWLRKLMKKWPKSIKKEP